MGAKRRKQQDSASSSTTSPPSQATTTTVTKPVKEKKKEPRKNKEETLPQLPTSVWFDPTWNVGEYIKDFVYGGLDGIITTFGCVSGVAGANLSCGVALVLGLANLIADGLSMAVGNYLGTKSEIEYERSLRALELNKIETDKGEQKQRVERIYAKKGFHGRSLVEAVEIITSNKTQWVDTIMIEEGARVDEKDPVIASLVTFFSFLFVGAVPLLAYVVALVSPPIVMEWSYILCLASTLFTIFGLGMVKGWLSGTSKLKSGLEMLVLGSIASAAAYYIGHVLQHVGH
eukprot:TRINITY_DN4853_c0_g1_i1.p1 TRINITY_DN4853_c0_g1~~TRINITY_DN4853_c0_g1_i1.p1  ORF type:complete len:288 (-),score=81.54 TRINITY_DN4853_c0_g1_i1:14-877(-)